MLFNKKIKNKYFVPVALAIFSILIVVILFLSFILINATNNPDQIAQNEIKKVVNTVGKLIVLPKDELPTIATVTDLEALRGQSFFVNAKVGDKILVYTKSKKAILYNPTLNKIIEIASLGISADNIVETQSINNK